MEALESKTYTTEKTLAERMNERLAELHMTKAEAAMRMNYSRSAVSQYLNGKYASDSTEIEKKITEFLIASGDTEGIPEAPDTTGDTGVKLKSKVEFFESRDFINTIGVCQACQENIGLGIIVGKSGQGKTHALKKYVKKIKEKVGNTPLADACIDSVENGAATIYCIPVKATTDGTVGEVKEAKTGEGTLEVSGKPNNAYDIVIKVTDDGENNEAGYAYSLDGGNTFSEEMTVPLNGEAVLANTGLTAKFTEAGGGDSFKEGDTFSFSTTAPSMSNADVISAVESLINNNTAFEFIHIVGTSSRALWASLATIANDFLTKYKRPLFFVCEARMKRSNESLDEYVAAMQEERKGINNIYIQVVCSNSRYQRMDGRVQDINNAGIVCGLYCKAKESQSIGEVKSFPISEAKMLKLLPEGIEDYIAVLDKAKYLTFRQYVGKEDYYVTSANMMAPDGSDYAYAEDVRVSNRLVKAVRAHALNELQTEIDPEDLDASISILQANLNTPVEKAVDDKIISSGRLEIDTENLNILVDETIDVRVTYVPMGHVREMNLTFAVENPVSAS